MSDLTDPEPRWQALIAIIAVTGLYVSLPSSLTIGPTWMVPVLVVVLAAPLLVLHRAGQHRMDRILGFTLTSILTIAMIASVAFLIGLLPAHKESPTQLLRSAALLWLTNVLVFALWYWRLDAGGPHARDERDTHANGAFLFPQMTMLKRVEQATELPVMAGRTTKAIVRAAAPINLENPEYDINPPCSWSHPTAQTG